MLSPIATAVKFPSVSVLIPTYNYAMYLDTAIESVLSQTYTDYELIIVDDKSSDNTDAVMEKYKSNDRIRYYKNEKNLGLVGNFNKCLEYASGKYIKYLLADDKFRPTLLEKFVSVMEAHPNVNLVTSHSEIFGDKSKPRHMPFTGLQKGRAVIFECLKNGNGNFLGEPSVVMFRKSSLEKTGHFSDAYTCLVDMNMWLRILMTGDCYMIPEVLSSFRVHRLQVSTRTNVQNWVDEYNFYKDVKHKNPYGLNSDQINQIDLDSIIKDRASHCAKVGWRSVHLFSRPGKRSQLISAFRIAAAERTLAGGLMHLVSKRLKNPAFAK